MLSQCYMKYLLSLIFCIVISSASAQVPYIIADYNKPLLNNNGIETVNTHLIMPMDPGTSGQLVDWYFNYSVLYYGFSEKGFFPSTPYAMDFPNAQYFIDGYGPPGILSFYFYADTSRFSMDGYLYNNTHGQNTYLVFSNDEDYIRYPLHYLDDYTDTFAARAVDPTDQSVTLRNGTAHVTCDGYGTIHLPLNNVYSNAMRVKFEEDYIDSNLTTQQTVYAHNLNYYWYLSGTRYPLYHQDTYNLNGTVTTFAEYLDSSLVQYQPLFVATATGIDNNSFQSLSCYAANNTFFIKNCQPDLHLSIYDEAGRLVMSQALPQSGDVNVPLQALASGFYVARINGVSVSVDRKIVVVK